MTTRAEDKAHAKDSVHVDNPDILEVDNIVIVVIGLEEVVGTKLEEQAEDGAEAGDAYNLVSNIEEEPTDVKDDEESLGERKRRSIIVQGKRREVPCEDEVPSTPKNNRSRPPNSPTSEPAEHPTRTKKKLRGVSAIFGFTPNAPKLLQRPVATNANRKHSPSRLLSGFRMPKLKGTSRLLNGAWKLSSGGDDSGSSPRKLKKMKSATLWTGTVAALSSPTPAPTVTATASESACSSQKKVVFPSKLWSSTAARELPAPEPAPTLSPGKKGAGVWGNAMRALRLPKEVKEPKKGVGTSIANDAKVNLALLMPKAVSAQIYSRKR